MDFRVGKEVDHSNGNCPKLMGGGERSRVTPSFILETRQVE